MKVQHLCRETKCVLQPSLTSEQQHQRCFPWQAAWLSFSGDPGFAFGLLLLSSQKQHQRVSSVSHGPVAPGARGHWLHKPLSSWPRGSNVGFCKEKGKSVFFLHFASFYVLKGRAEYKYCSFYRTGRSFLERKRKLVHPACCTFH